jgi:hypothetical protein
VISGVENSDKFQKNKVFGREKLSWGRGNTGHTSSYYDHIEHLFEVLQSYKTFQQSSENILGWDICVMISHYTYVFFYRPLKME